MEKEKLKWEKDFSHNWSILKNVNTNFMNMSADVDKPEKDNISPFNEAISNIGGITTHLDDINTFKEDKTNMTKLNNNLSYNFNFFRNLIIVIDMTEKMNMNDYRPTRHKFLFKRLEYLITNFFKYNFISTITIISIKNYMANIISTYSNDVNFILDNLRRETEPEGSPSIFNALSVSSDYLTVLDKFNSDIVFFYSSKNTLDRGNVYDIIEQLSENKTEVHFFTFETPFELLNTITKTTGGVLFHSKSVDDIDIFMNYIIFKKTKVRNPNKIQFPKLIQIKSHDVLCWCHNKLCNTYYQCNECLNVYCKIPVFCKLCNNVLLNDLFLHQLMNSGKENINLEKINFEFNSIPQFFNNFFHDKKLKINNVMTYINFNNYREFAIHYIESIKIVSKKDLTKTHSDREKDSNLLDLKKAILFLKYNKGDKVYSNMDRILIFNKKNIENFSIRTRNFFLRETIICIGCDTQLEKNKTKSISNFEDFFMCLNCTEIQCVNCVKYIQNNNLGCLNCESL